MNVGRSGLGKKLIHAILDGQLDKDICAVARETAAKSVDALGRTPLHYAAMTSVDCDQCIYSGPSTSLYCPCIVNLNVFDLRAKDKFGRTPLHYACMSGSYTFSAATRNDGKHTSQAIEELLQIQDNDGFTPQQILDNTVKVVPSLCWSQNRPITDVLLASAPQDSRVSSTRDAIKSVEDEFDFSNRLPEHQNLHEIWASHRASIGVSQLIREEIINLKECDTNFLASRVHDAVTSFMMRLVEAIGDEDPRLRGCLLPVGSAVEQTKINRPKIVDNEFDEFDFDVVLANFGEMCEVLPPEDTSIPSGYVQLNRKQEAGYTTGYDDLFNSDDGTLHTTKLNFAFQAALITVLSGQKFWDNEPWFEHDTGIYDVYRSLYDVVPKKIEKTIRLKFVRPICEKFVACTVLIDIVPVIHVPRWWPEDGREVDGDIKSEGCYFVFKMLYK
jgi:hypothetical protein